LWPNFAPKPGTDSEFSIFMETNLREAGGHFWGYTPRFFEKLFTAEPRPGDPRSAGFSDFFGILAAWVYQIGVHRFLKKVVRDCPHLTR
jgi:hypothetical protein